MNVRNAKVASLLLHLVLLTLTQAACTTTAGAPKGDEAYEAESSGEAIEEEEEEEESREVDL